jgi:nitrate reductase gamma subunit
VKKVLFALAAVLVIATAGASAGEWLPSRWLFAVVLPYASVLALLAGLSWRIISWSLAPVPFHIPTVCGQQKSLAWIKRGRLESPTTTLGVVGRMALEILLFRSLFRNNRANLVEGPRLVFSEEKLLWFGALVFHWSFLFVLIRHLRLLVEPVPAIAAGVEAIDGFFQVGAPVIYATDVAIVAALLFLVGRRLYDSRVRYISLFTDYFALLLLLGIAISGIGMRYFARVDVVSAKQFALGLVTFSPILPNFESAWFFAHLTLVSTLAAYFPFSKLVHAGGVFLSPTRNLANDSRMRRHVNPWNYPVKVHTYEEWETEFHDKIAAAGLPLERP